MILIDFSLMFRCFLLFLIDRSWLLLPSVDMDTFWAHSKCCGLITTSCCLVRKHSIRHLNHRLRTQLCLLTEELDHVNTSSDIYTLTALWMRPGQCFMTFSTWTTYYGLFDMIYRCLLTYVRKFCHGHLNSVWYSKMSHQQRSSTNWQLWLILWTIEYYIFVLSFVLYRFSYCLSCYSMSS